jgi:hypothetical protein
MRHIIKIAAFCFLLLESTQNSFGQTTIESFKIGNFTYAKPSIKNFVHWLNISTSEWETEMKKFQFSDRGVQSGGVYYGTGADLGKYVYSITKYPGNMMNADWGNFARDGITKFDDLANELEPYFLQTDDKGRNIYQYKTSDAIYEFTMRRNGDELVFVKKFPNN